MRSNHSRNALGGKIGSGIGPDLICFGKIIEYLLKIMILPYFPKGVKNRSQACFYYKDA